MKTKKNLGKRALSVLLTLLMVLSLVPMSGFSAFAEELAELSATIDTGESITLKDADGNGYYDIGNADELYAFAALVNGGKADLNAELTTDIVVNEGVMTAESTDARVWTPIGDDDYSYSGTFDGNNKTISGLYFNDSSKKYIGLFGYIIQDGVVENVGVINSYFCGNVLVGGVAGYSNGTITNCYYLDTAYTGGIYGEVKYDRYYYSQLTDDEKQLYELVETGIRGLSTKIDLENPLDFAAYDNVLTRVVYSVLNDYPEYFWCTDKFSLNVTGEQVTSIAPVYNDLNKDLDNNKKLFADAVNEILEENDEANGYLALLDLYDSLILNGITSLNESTDDTSNAFAALVTKEADASGISKAYSVLVNAHPDDNISYLVFVLSKQKTQRIC